MSHHTNSLSKCRSQWPIFHRQVIFILISGRQFDYWTSYFGTISRCDATFDFKINVGNTDLYFTVNWFCHILKTIWWMNILIWDNESVWPDLWPQNVGQHNMHFRTQWPCPISRTIFDWWTLHFATITPGYIVRGNQNYADKILTGASSHELQTIDRMSTNLLSRYLLIS